RRSLLEVSLRARAPDHHRTIELTRDDEGAHVGTELFDQLPLAAAAFHVGTVYPGHCLAVEYCRPRLDRLEVRTQLLEGRRVEHPRVRRGLKRIFGKDVPGAELQILEGGERHEFADQRRPLLGALAEANGAHLRERPVRLRQTLADGLHAGHEGRAHRAKSDEHYTKPPAGRHDVNGWVSHGIPPKMVASSARRSSVLSGGSRASGSQR